MIILAVKFSLQIPLNSYEDALWEAKFAEKQGFDGGWVSDFVTPPPYHLDPLTVLGCLARDTENLLLITAVMGASRIHPNILAKTIGTIDNLSKGRLILGLGLGGAMKDKSIGLYDNLRLTRLQETIEILNGLWRGGKTSYNGKAYSLKDVEAHVKPVKSHIPIWVAAQSPNTQRITGEFADGWISNWAHSPETFKRSLENVRDHAKKAGRNPTNVMGCLEVVTVIEKTQSDAERIGLPLTRNVIFPRTVESYVTRELQALGYPHDKVTKPEDITDDLLKTCSLIGDPEKIIRRVEEYQRAGVQHFLLLLNHRGQPGLHRQSAELFAKHVIQYFKENN